MNPIKMKAYISADLRVISLRANDIVTASGDVNNDATAAWSTSGRRDLFDDSYDEF